MRIIQHEETAGFAHVVSLRDVRGCKATRFGGVQAGPTLLVAIGCGLFEPVSQRLGDVPTLAWMRGRIVLVRLSGFEDFAEHIDDTLTLVQWAMPGDEAAVDAAYWTVLRKAARLGMIAGRGVPIV